MESKITLKDVKGVDQLKEDLEEIVHYLRASEVSSYVNSE